MNYHCCLFNKENPLLFFTFETINEIQTVVEILPARKKQQR